MKYVKLIAKPGTWFKSGTEVYHYDCNPPDNLYRISLEEWNEHQTCGIGVRGIRVIDDEIEANNIGGFIGEERWDGEWCSVDEFEVTIVRERI